MKRIARWAQQIGVARAVCFALLFALVPLRLADPAPLAELRVRAFDFFQVLRPRVQTIRPVVIVDIDEASLKEIGQWPWPRTTIADLVTGITQLGAVAIGFDIIFPEPDRMSPSVAERSFRGIDAETAPSSTASQVMTMRWPTPSSIRASWWDRPVRRSSNPKRRRKRRCKPDSRYAAPIPAPIWSRFRACCGTCPRSNRPPPAAGYFPSIRKAMELSAACRSS